MRGRKLSIEERASRQKVMMALRVWMETNDVSRSTVAQSMNITTGHLSTLINANRSASDKQVEIAQLLMSGPLGESSIPLPSEMVLSPAVKKEPRPRAVPEARSYEYLRPLTKVEGDFITNVAKTWLDAHKGAPQDEFVAVVRALGIAIRS